MTSAFIREEIWTLRHRDDSTVMGWGGRDSSDRATVRGVLGTARSHERLQRDMDGCPLGLQRDYGPTDTFHTHF
jgi:hypothetical protein